MIPYVEREDVFPAEAIYAFEAAKAIVWYIPDSPELRCHEVARVVGKLIGADVVDGKYGMCEHSWLTNTAWDNPEWPGRGVILDVYAVGQIPQVVLVDTFPTPKLFQAGSARRDIQKDWVEHAISFVDIYAGRIEAALERVDGREWWHALWLQRQGGIK